MLILKGMPCDAAMRRGLLWHSWLKNQILKMDAGYVVHIHSRPDLQEERESFERKIRPSGEFDSKIKEARQFVRDMVEGFSPAQLIDTGPLASLSAEARASIKSTIHVEYLIETMMEHQTEPISVAIDELEQALKKFARAWSRQPPADRALVSQRFEQLQEAARTLHERLGNLPEGIVLP